MSSTNFMIKNKWAFIKVNESYQKFIFFALCIIFGCIKILNLNTPLFWDEAWVYAPAIKEMAKDGISLLPHALSDSYSRGHPLLFFTTGAIWVKLFGGSLFSMHLFALTIAISFICTLFYIVKKIFDSTLALIVASITLVQPIFVAQSALDLPEVFLSLWAILTIYHFVRQNKIYYLFFGTLLVLTKESGIVIIASLLLYQAISFCTNKITVQSLKLFILNSIISFIPMFFFVTFLVIQHHQRGYYFFPEHIALLNFNWHDFQEQLKHCYDYLFERQGRLYITYSFLILFGLFYKPIPMVLRLFLVIGLVACVKIFFRYWTLPDWVMILFIGVFTSIFYYIMHVKYAVASKQAASLLAILFLTSILYLIFSSVNFITARYLFFLVPLMILYFSYYVKESLRFYAFLPYAWTVLLMSVVLYGIFFYSNGLGDDSPKYIQSVKLEEKIVRYLEQQNIRKDTINCAFTMNIALKDTNMGYLSGRFFANTTGELNKNIKYIIYTNIDVDSDSLWIKGSDSLAHFHIIKKFDYGVANGKIFMRNY